MSLAAALLREAGAPGGRVCGAAVIRAFPSAPKLQAALRGFTADAGEHTSTGLVEIARDCAARHGIAETPAKPGCPAIGIADINGYQTFALFDGAAWFVVGNVGIRHCPGKLIAVAFEVA